MSAWNPNRVGGPVPCAIQWSEWGVTACGQANHCWQAEFIVAIAPETKPQAPYPHRQS